RAKLVVNAWLLGVVNTLAESIALAESLELDPEVLFQAVDGGPLDLPYARIKGGMIIERAFSDAAFKLALARKDAELVLEASASVNLELPLMDAVVERLRRAERDGHGDQDMAAAYWATPPRASEFADGPRG